jgi:alkylhydroperoxidase/carboxymuconolactone decarboxylase family protein YurZ
MSEEKFVDERGQRVAVEMYGPAGVQQVETDMGVWAELVDADWARAICDFSINSMYARSELPTAIRELCAVSALTVMQETVALEAHIRISLGIHPPAVVRGAILQTAVMAGIPIAVKGLRVFEKVMAEHQPPTT